MKAQRCTSWLPTANEIPAQGSWVPLNIDGSNLPSDWYLRLAAGRLPECCAVKSRSKAPFLSRPEPTLLDCWNERPVAADVRRRKWPKKPSRPPGYLGGATNFTASEDKVGNFGISPGSFDPTAVRPKQRNPWLDETAGWSRLPAVIPTKSLGRSSDCPPVSRDPHSAQKPRLCLPPARLGVKWYFNCPLVRRNANAGTSRPPRIHHPSLVDSHDNGI